MKYTIPDVVLETYKTLRGAGFEAYFVGGCVRDLIIERAPKDWDITTNATPQAIQPLFRETFYENKYGTVGVVTTSDDPRLKIVEVTPYRVESTYANARHPDRVEWSERLSDDLRRRDFTINALAYDPEQDSLIDEHGGQEDLKRGVVRTVGDPQERFSEDALRMMRAIRIAAELGFAIDVSTATGIASNSRLLAKISRERVRDELVRILESDQPMPSLFLAQKLGILVHMIPELEEGIGIRQNQAHSFEVFEHILRTLQHAADRRWPLEVRLAALLHDIGKPASRRWSDEKKDWTFYGHDVIGARMTRKILTDLRFSKDIIEKVELLVRWHMFFSDPDKITLSAVRRVVSRVGTMNIKDLLNLRICDRIGTGRPKEHPFRLRKYMSMVDEAMRDPVSVSMLKIDGAAVMKLGERPGPRIGWVLHALLEEVLDDPKKNTEENLERRTQELLKLDDAALKALGERGKGRKQEEDEEAVRVLRDKYHVS